VNINETLTKLGLESISSTLSPEYKHIYTLDAEVSHVRINALLCISLIGNKINVDREMRLYSVRLLFLSRAEDI